MGLLERVALHIKTMGIYFIVPFFAYYIVIPVITWVFLKSPVVNISYETAFIDYAYQIIPVCSTIWIFFSLRDYIEAEGREILWREQQPIEVIAILYIINIISLSIFPIAWKDGKEEMMGLYLQMVVITFFLYGLIYFFILLLQNIAIPLFLLFSYVAFSLSGSDIANHLQYTILNQTDWDENSGIFVWLGLLFWIGGFFLGTKKGEVKI